MMLDLPTSVDIDADLYPGALNNTFDFFRRTTYSSHPIKSLVRPKSPSRGGHIPRCRARLLTTAPSTSHPDWTTANFPMERSFLASGKLEGDCERREIMWISARVLSSTSTFVGFRFINRPIYSLHLSHYIIHFLL